MSAHFVANFIPNAGKKVLKNQLVSAQDIIAKVVKIWENSDLCLQFEISTGQITFVNILFCYLDLELYSLSLNKREPYSQMLFLASSFFQLKKKIRMFPFIYYFRNDIPSRYGPIFKYRLS